MGQRNRRSPCVSMAEVNTRTRLATCPHSNAEVPASTRRAERAQNCEPCAPIRGEKFLLKGRRDGRSGIGQSPIRGGISKDAENQKLV